MSDTPSKLGKYDIIRTLGEGAMGTVYEAIDRVIERTVAIKTIRKSDLDAEEAAEHSRRFLIEARAAGKLNHPHIISLYDHGDEAGMAYIVMELVQGRELQRYFDDKVAFPLADVVRLMGELLDALGYSHRRGVVHRDVKPANIFITDGGGLKLGDFGIAHIESSQRTRVGLVMGTPSYMAPEQIRGESADARSDLYAAGVVLYQFLTGERPYSGNMLAMALKVLNDPIPLACAINPAVTPQLDEVVSRALAKNATARYQSAAEFWHALAGAVGLTVAAAPTLTALSSPGRQAGDRSPVVGTGLGATASLGAGAAPPGDRTSPGPPLPAPRPPGTAATAAATASLSPPVSAPAAAPAAAFADAPLDVAAAEAGPSATPAHRRLIGVAAAALTVFALAGWWMFGRTPDEAVRPALETPAPGPTLTPTPTPAAAPLPVPAERPAVARMTAPPAPLPDPVPSEAAPVATPGLPGLPGLPRAASAPAASPREHAPPAAKPPPVDTKAGGQRPPLRETRSAAVRPAPAADTAPTISPTISPMVKAQKPQRCSDILQKASLEPLSSEEAAFLRKECR